MQLVTLFDRTVFLEPAFLKWLLQISICHFLSVTSPHLVYASPLFVKWASSYGKINWHTIKPGMPEHRTTEHRTVADQWNTGEAMTLEGQSEYHEIAE